MSITAKKVAIEAVIFATLERCWTGSRGAGSVLATLALAVSLSSLAASPVGRAQSSAQAQVFKPTLVQFAQAQSINPGGFTPPGSAASGTAASALRGFEQLQELQGMLEKYNISLPPELRFSQELRTLAQQTQLIDARISLLERIAQLTGTHRDVMEQVQGRIKSLPPEVLVLMYEIGDISSILRAGRTYSPVRSATLNGDAALADDDDDVAQEITADQAGLALVDELVSVHWASNLSGGEVVPEQPVRLVASFGGQYYEIKTGDHIAGFEIGLADELGVGVIVFRGEDRFSMKF